MFRLSTRFLILDDQCCLSAFFEQYPRMQVGVQPCVVVPKDDILVGKQDCLFAFSGWGICVFLCLQQEEKCYDCHVSNISIFGVLGENSLLSEPKWD